MENLFLCSYDCRRKILPCCLLFYFNTNTDNRINYRPVLENIVYLYAKSKDYQISVGRIGKLECDFILRDNQMNYAYVQVVMTKAGFYLRHIYDKRYTTNLKKMLI